MGDRVKECGLSENPNLNPPIETETLISYRSTTFNNQSKRDSLAIAQICTSLFAFLLLALYEEVRAAHNVLEACAQTEIIDKVIFTSSATSVVWREDRKTMEPDLDERHWRDINFCRKFKLLQRQRGMGK